MENILTSILILMKLPLDIRIAWLYITQYWSTQH